MLSISLFFVYSVFQVISVNVTGLIQLLYCPRLYGVQIETAKSAYMCHTPGYPSKPGSNSSSSPSHQEQISAQSLCSFDHTELLLLRPIHNTTSCDATCDLRRAATAAHGSQYSSCLRHPHAQVVLCTCTQGRNCTVRHVIITSRKFNDCPKFIG